MASTGRGSTFVRVYTSSMREVLGRLHARLGEAQIGRHRVSAIDRRPRVGSAGRDKLAGKTSAWSLLLTRSSGPGRAIHYQATIGRSPPDHKENPATVAALSSNHFFPRTKRARRNLPLGIGTRPMQLFRSSRRDCSTNRCKRRAFGPKKAEFCEKLDLSG